MHVLNYLSLYFYIQTMGVFSLDITKKNPQFKYLSVENIVSFLKEEIRDPLHKITINIKSKENAVDDPLNQNIYCKSQL